MKPRTLLAHIITWFGVCSHHVRGKIFPDAPAPRLKCAARERHSALAERSCIPDLKHSATTRGTNSDRATFIEQEIHFIEKIPLTFFTNHQLMASFTTKLNLGLKR